MLGLKDYRKSRFYQEARQDGIDEGKAEGEAQAKAEVILRLASKGYEAKEIVYLVGVELQAVRKILKSQSV